MTTSPAPLLVLVAGPYRSGTGDDPALIAAKMRLMTTFSLRLFHAGHLPVTGEALALPLVEAAGSARVGDEVFDAIFHPVARRLVRRCDPVLRVGGPSKGADKMVALAEESGAAVYRRLDDVPGCAS